MHTVAETYAFQRAAKHAGMTVHEVLDLINGLARNPMMGVELAETGGCRKFRFAGRGKGKSGGYRIVTFYTGEVMPVFLITVFSKGEKASLTKGELIALGKLTNNIVEQYQNKLK